MPCVTRRRPPSRVVVRPRLSGYGRLDGLSAGRVDAEDAVEAGDLEDADDVLVRTHDVEIAVARPHAFRAAHDLAHKDHHTDVAAECLVAHAELRPLLHARLLPSSAGTTPGRRPGACDPLVSAAVRR